MMLGITLIIGGVLFIELGAHCTPRRSPSRTRRCLCLRPGHASELVMFCYGRIPMDSLQLDGDRRVFDQLIAWKPEE
ncbi:hypothetical protein ACFYPX_27265 [Micromonospora zamorensis]|uniref:hypothetical protein n=1 Tax=Micromonospora zamorensis TaxID=709883 RepID=UPI003695CB5C